MERAARRADDPHAERGAQRRPAARRAAAVGPDDVVAIVVGPAAAHFDGIRVPVRAGRVTGVLDAPAPRAAASVDCDAVGRARAHLGDSGLLPQVDATRPRDDREAGVAGRLDVVELAEAEEADRRRVVVVIPPGRSRPRRRSHRRPPATASATRPPRWSAVGDSAKAAHHRSADATPSPG